MPTVNFRELLDEMIKLSAQAGGLAVAGMLTEDHIVTQRGNEVREQLRAYVANLESRVKELESK